MSRTLADKIRLPGNNHPTHARAIEPRRPALLEVPKRDRVDAHPTLVNEIDTAAELDHAVITHIDAVMEVQARALYVEVITRPESAVHAIRRYREPGLDRCGFDLVARARGPSTRLRRLRPGEPITPEYDGLPVMP
jgi:hypothetical protein